MTTHRSGPKCKQQVLTFLSRLIWCCRKRNYRGRSFAGAWRWWNRKAQAERWSGGNCPGRCGFGVRPVGGAGGEEACRRLPKCSCASRSALAEEGRFFRSTPPRAASARTPTSPLCPQLKGRNRNLDGLKHLPRIV